MAYDAHKNFSYSTVATAPSPAISGTTLVVASGDGAKFPTAPFNATVWPIGAIPTTANAEIVRVTNVATDTLTITRAQESTSARTVIVGDQIAATITTKTLTDVETLLSLKALSPQTTRGDLIVEDSTPTPTRLAVGAVNTVLRSNGVDPAWAALVGPAQFLLPTGALAQTVPRVSGGTNTAALTTQRVTLSAIWLPKDLLITSITFVAFSALSAATNQWFVLTDSSLNKLAITSDDGATAWGGLTAKTLNLASQFTTTYEGLHYLGCMVKAGVLPTLLGQTATTASKDLAPILSGVSATTGLTNPASCPSTLGAIGTGHGAIEYAYVS